jgi:hypothetical protein
MICDLILFTYEEAQMAKAQLTHVQMAARHTRHTYKARCQLITCKAAGMRTQGHSLGRGKRSTGHREVPQQDGRPPLDPRSSTRHSKSRPFRILPTRRKNPKELTFFGGEMMMRFFFTSRLSHTTRLTIYNLSARAYILLPYQLSLTTLIS